MKLGIIVRNNNKGLGIQSWEACRHLKPDRVMVIELPEDKDGDINRFTECEFLRVKGIPNAQEIDKFISGLNTVFMCETPYSYQLLARCRDLGIKTVLQPNYEFYAWRTRPSMIKPDILTIPSLWHQGDYNHAKDYNHSSQVYLPVPITTEHWEPLSLDIGRPSRILHTGNVPAANDRNGTGIVLECLQYIKSDIELTITTKAFDAMEQVIRQYKVPRNVILKIDGRVYENYWDAYNGYDLMVLPRRYGGLSLPVNESLGAGMPVIMSDIEPNNLWLPREWLVEAVKEGEFQAHKETPGITYYKTDPKALAAKIDEMCQNSALYHDSLLTARRLREMYSWSALLPLYNKVLR
jgi:glycosyltransferase involved in cell wall biosynthesis